MGGFGATFRVHFAPCRISEERERRKRKSPGSHHLQHRPGAKSAVDFCKWFKVATGVRGQDEGGDSLTII